MDTNDRWGYTDDEIAGFGLCIARKRSKHKRSMDNRAEDSKNEAPQSN